MEKMVINYKGIEFYERAITRNHSFAYVTHKSMLEFLKMASQKRRDFDILEEYLGILKFTCIFIFETSRAKRSIFVIFQKRGILIFLQIFF